MTDKTLGGGLDASLTYELVDRSGRPFALWSDGTLLPLISGGDGPNDPPAPPPSPDPAPAPVPPPPGDPALTPPADAGKVTFTPEQQAHIDKLIEKNTGKSKAAAEKDFKTWLDQQAMSETDRIKAESEAKDKAVTDAQLEVLKTRVDTAAERYAIAAGVNAGRVTKFMRLVDLDVDKLTDDGKPDTDAIKTLIDAEVAANPEFKGSAGNSAGASGGEFNGSGNKKTWTRAEIAKLDVDEYEKHEDEILAQVKAGTVK